MEATARPSETPADVNNESNGLDGTPDATAKRKRQPRNSACQSCAVRIHILVADSISSPGKYAVTDDILFQGLKMKCIASSVAGICER
jgi:hypothetical protein